MLILSVSKEFILIFSLYDKRLSLKNNLEIGVNALVFFVFISIMVIRVFLCPLYNCDIYIFHLLK